MSSAAAYISIYQRFICLMGTVPLGSYHLEDLFFPVYNPKVPASNFAGPRENMVKVLSYMK